MCLEQVNGMHIITIQEKDHRIKELLDRLNGSGAKPEVEVGSSHQTDE